MKKTDIVYYVGYLTLFIMFGVWMLVWALDALNFRDAFLFWMLSAGMMLVIIGAIGASNRVGSNFQLGAGLMLSAFTLIILGVTSKAMVSLVGAALAIILIGIIGLILLLKNIKMEA